MGFPNPDQFDPYCHFFFNTGHVTHAQHIKQKVENCVICAKEVHNAPEPLLTTPLPARPWQRFAADQFQW